MKNIAKELNKLILKLFNLYLIITFIPVIPKVLLFIIFDLRDLDKLVELLIYLFTNAFYPWWIYHLELLLTIPGFIGVLLATGFLTYIVHNKLVR